MSVARRSLWAALLLLACGGKSTSRAAPGDSGSGASGSAGTGGANGGSPAVDVYGVCPAGPKYFIDIGGDLPEGEVTMECGDDSAITTVPVYDDLHALDPAEAEWPALIGCGGDRLLEIWRLPLPSDAGGAAGEDLATAGLYVSNHETYATCGTSRYVRDSSNCSPLGRLSLAPPGDAKGVLEGGYSMTLFDSTGTPHDVTGNFRVCNYLAGL